MIAMVASGQSLRIGVERRAHDYEAIETIPTEVSREPDRDKVAEFLEDKWEARAIFSQAAQGACPLFLTGEVSVAEFAAHLDSEVVEMNGAIATSYTRMTARLSPQGKSELQIALRKSAPTSTDTRAVDIATVDPGAAGARFKDLCD
jgi:hypothetical protein